jgi:hypothetical protein
MAVKVDKDNDLVFFPLPASELTGAVGLEQMRYLNRMNLDCCDLDDKRKWDKSGHLFIFGHGTGTGLNKHQIGGDGRVMRAAWDVAKDIAEMGFPKGADNEIYAWSCYSGVVGGFAQLLALYLTNYGYTGKKVWACNKYTGLISDTLHLQVAESSSSPRPRRAEAGDITYWVGA